MTTQLAAVALGVVCLCSATLPPSRGSPPHRDLARVREHQDAAPPIGAPPAGPDQAPTRRLPAIRIDAGRVDRIDIVVSFQLPPTITGEFLQLRAKAGTAEAASDGAKDARHDTARNGATEAARDDTNDDADDGPTIPLQIDKDRRAWFVLDSLKAGETRSFTIEPMLDREERLQRVDVIGERDGLTLRALQRPVLRYQADRSEPPRPDIKPIYRRGGYLHPVRTPSGRIITDDYPPAYLNHHGIWAAWAKTIFQGRTPDFWRMGDGTGSVEFESLLDTWSGRVEAGFQARHRYVDLTAPTPTTVLTETWEIRLYAAGLPRDPLATAQATAAMQSRAGGRPRAGEATYRLFDLVLTQELVRPGQLVLPEFMYGGVAFHGPRSWDGPRGSQILTSEGKTRANGDATRARWCYITGPVGNATPSATPDATHLPGQGATDGAVDGRTTVATAGIAILSHPANANAPQPVRMYPNEPFLSFAPTQGGRLDLAFGRPFVLRYRFVTFDGPPNVSLIERLWRDYAEPVVVEVLPGAPVTQ